VKTRTVVILAVILTLLGLALLANAAAQR